MGVFFLLSCKLVGTLTFCFTSPVLVAAPCLVINDREFKVSSNRVSGESEE